MTIDHALNHLHMHHSNARGYITLAKKQGDDFKQFYCRPNEAASYISELLGEDVFYSQNTFYRPSRKIEHIKQLRALYVDIDCYLMNYDPNFVIEQMEHDFFNTVVPEPNIIIYSGRGIVPVWFLHNTPSQALPLWQAIQQYFGKKLKDVGADFNALDAARVFRIAGSINSKNGNEVMIQHRHDERYVLRDIQRKYLPQEWQKNKVSRGRGRPSKISQIKNMYTLHYSRLMDLLELINLRNYEMNGYREKTCFLYRYWQCCYLKNEEDALQFTLELNQSFTDPLKESEVVHATKSAEKAWQAKNNKEADRLARSLGYPGAGYNLKNSTIIDWLDITQGEQSHLQAIIGASEKKRRNTLYQRKKRREQGVKSREDYLKQQKEQSDKKAEALKQALEDNINATHKELAEKLGCSTKTIQRYLKQL